MKLACQHENNKEKHYAKVIKENNAIFYPLVLEAHGGFGHKFTRFLNLLKTDAIDHHQLSETEAEAWLRNAKCSIAVALQVGNGMMSTRSMRSASMKRKRTGSNEQAQSQTQDSSLFVDLEEAQSRELAAAA